MIGMFIFSWYKEVDNNGKELPGYQHKECVAYKLTLTTMATPSGGRPMFSSSARFT